MAAATQITLGLDLCKKITEQYKLVSLADNKSNGLLISGQQCMLVCNKLLETQGTLELLQLELPDEETSSPDVGQATQELVQVLTRAYETFFKDCFCNEWMESALRQHGDLKETASGILYDLQWSCSILWSILLKRAGQDNQALKREDCHGMLSARDRYALTIAAKRDQKNLKALLRDLKENHTCSGECWDGKQVSAPCLAAQLLKKIDFQAQSKAAQKEYYEGLPPPDRNTLSKWPLALLISQKDLQSEAYVASGSFGEVFKVVWRGETYAMKRPKRGYINDIKQEIEALVGLNHPHVMRLLCCTEECSYIMELMDMSLHDMLLDRHHISCILQAVDLMLQVAEGMKYLHNLGIVHRDLKPQHILVKKVQEVSVDHHPDFKNSTSCPLSNPVWIAKITDFSTSKVTNQSTVYSNETIPIGTTLYMAPEVYELDLNDEEPQRFHPMKTDVYSFGILCSTVVTGNPPRCQIDGVDVATREFKASVRQGKRPNLPPDCPARLSGLIKQCWHADPLLRPSFPDICTELRYIKGLLLTDDNKSTLAKLPSTLAKLPPNERFQGIKTEGPFGGQGCEFVACGTPMSIRSIEIHYESGPKPLIWTIKVEQEDTTVFGGYMRAVNGKREKFSLDPDEFLTQVEGYYGANYRKANGDEIQTLSAITFHTNLERVYGPYGGGKEPDFTHFQSSVGKIVGFFGSTGCVVDQLGVFISHDLTDDKSTLATLPPNERFQGIKVMKDPEAQNRGSGFVGPLGVSNKWDCQSSSQEEGFQSTYQKEASPNLEPDTSEGKNRNNEIHQFSQHGEGLGTYLDQVGHFVVTENGNFEEENLQKSLQHMLIGLQRHGEVAVTNLHQFHAECMGNSIFVATREVVEGVEFLFSDAQCMSRMVGVGLERAKVLVTSGYEVEVMQFGNIWKRSWEKVFSQVKDSESFELVAIKMPKLQGDHVQSMSLPAEDISRKFGASLKDFPKTHVITLNCKEEQSGEFFPLVWKVVDEYRNLKCGSTCATTKQTSGTGSAKSPNASSSASIQQSTSGGGPNFSQSPSLTRQEENMDDDEDDDNSLPPEDPLPPDPSSALNDMRNRRLKVSIFPGAGGAFHDPDTKQLVWQTPFRQVATIMPVIEIEFLQEGVDRKFITVTTKTQCNLGTDGGPKWRGVNSFSWYQDNIKISFKGKDQQTQLLSSSASAQDDSLIETKLTINKALMASNSSSQEESRGAGGQIHIAGSGVQGQIDIKATETQGGNLTIANTQEIGGIKQIQGFIVHPRCRENDLVFNFCLPSRLMPGSSTQSGVDLQSLSQCDDTFEPKVTGKWIVWSEEQHACYVFKVRRYLYRLPPSKLNQDEIECLMQDYKLLMFVNLAMTHLDRYDTNDHVRLTERNPELPYVIKVTPGG